MTATHPTLISAADELPADPSNALDSWWFTARLHAGEATFWVKIHTMTVQGTCHSTVALLQEPGPHTSEKQTAESLDAVSLSADSLGIRTSILRMSGGLDDLEITGATDSATVHLTLRRDEPVLYNGGSGLFPFFGGTCGQYALPGLTTSGTITADGTTYHVSGRTWFDRQWGSEGTEPPRFTWLGLDLGAGRYLSVWDTTGDGTSWLTELKADGTHTITRAQRTDHNGTWRLTVPDLDASLEITHRGLPDSHDGLYAGVCSVAGTLAGEDIAGHGYTDVIG
ncbi:putative mucin-1 (MUC-1) [Streptomyces himastatinicus ATCC 53653]|uniref:Putative mucin-1 (MUC-1) n=1 Tax=Streptomyces himastatinicus ATCC 53653 TaxID=457427 RepID=D9WFW4_9ACTN|nr:putative mucin-1 (MUC-1) [Streptomyces himastatinicus]EFL21200.1 putative mucin-1 (MUC-1) [Streptomyces himastatinicus ATCC 53653]